MKIQGGPEPILMTPGAVHYLDLDLEAGWFVHAIALQEGIDVKVRLRRPDGSVLWEVDSPNGDRGPEEILEIVDASGRFRIEVVAPSEGEEGTYRFELRATRPAEDNDHLWVAADHAYHEGRRRAKAKDAIGALDALRESLAFWQRHEVPEREAATLEALAIVHQQRRELPLALGLSIRAANLYETIENPRRQAVARDRAGLLHLRLGQTVRAISELEKALDLYRQESYMRGQALALARLATAHRQRGEMQRALHAFDQALALISEGSPRSRANVLMDTGALVLRLHRPDEARRRYQEALTLFRSTEDLRGTALALNGLASCAINDGNARNGLAEAVEALELFEGIDDPRQGAAQVSIGRIRHIAGEHDLARKAYETAITISESAESHATAAAAHLGLGYLLNGTGQSRAGLEHLKRSRARFEQAGDLLGVASADARFAEALLTLGELTDARAHIEAALDTVDTVREHADRRDHRLGYFASRQRYFEIAIDVAMAQHAAEPEAGYHLEAFELHERRLARELRDALQRPVERLATSVEPSDEERKLERRLGELAAGPASAADSAAEATRRETRDVLDKLHAMWATRAAGTVDTRDETPSPSLEQIRDLLDADTLLVSFALGEKQSFVWTCSVSGLTAHRLPPRADIEQLARSFLPRVVSAVHRRRAEADDLGRRLSALLLGPIADQIDGKRLVIAPDGILHAIPFGALPKLEGEVYLIEKHELVVLPSAAILAQLRRSEATREATFKNIVVFADPVFSRDDSRMSTRAKTESEHEAPTGEGTRGDLERLGRQLGFDPYARLEHSHAEAAVVRELVPEGRYRLVTGFDASREAFVSLDAGTFSVLHVATHAVSSPEHAELSGLVLSLIDDHGRRRDGFVRAYEIARMDLPFELVNLSACQTGVGTEIAGEGMLGLARAFLTAGAARVIASHWNVSDRHTASLMTRFYDAYLNRGESPAAALRSAQLELLADPETAAPSAWAGFTLHGDWRSPWAHEAWEREIERLRTEDAADRRQRPRRKAPPIEELEVPDEPTDEGPYLDLPDPDDVQLASGVPQSAGGDRPSGRKRAVWERLAAARRHIEAEVESVPAVVDLSLTPTEEETRASLLSTTPEELGRWLEERIAQGTIHDLDPWAAASASRLPVAGRELPQDVDPHDLAKAGWGVIYPRGQRDRVDARLGPLLEHRKRQAKTRFKMFPYDGESAAAFLGERGETLGVIRPEKVPYYLLVIGGPAEVPFDFQYELNVNHAVGRLCFDDDQDHHHYATAVCRAERDAVPASPTVGIFSVENDHDRATELLSRHLAGPLERNLRSYVSDYALERWHRDDATKDRLLRIYGDARPPGLVLAACHGHWIPPGGAGQKAYQGALMCQKDPIGSDRRFAAEDVPASADLCGQISFLFSCYGAGTPLLDNFPQHPRQKSQIPGRPALLADRPFVARLPQTLLARGALAVVGHVDRGWTLSFSWSRVDEDVTAVWTLEDTLKRLLVGHRLGHAMRPMFRRYTAFATRLGRLFERRRIGVPIDPAQLAEAWTAYHDTRNFIILGDPAVYLRGKPGNRNTIRLDRELATRAAAHARIRGEPVDRWANRVLAASLDAERPA